MTRLFLILMIYVAAPAYADFEAVGLPEVSAKNTVTQVTQIAQAITR